MKKDSQVTFEYKKDFSQATAAIQILLAILNNINPYRQLIVEESKFRKHGSR